MSPPTWLVSLVSALGALAMALAAVRNSRVAAVLGLAQAGQSRAQTDQLEATTVDTLFARIDRLQRDAEARDRKLAGVEDELREIRRWVANVKRSAPRIGVAVSGRGVLSLAPGATILVVDDDPGIRGALGTYLSEEGYTIREAATTEEAISQARAELPACAIVDLWLGPGQSAPDLVADLRKLAPAGAVPVILCTADASARSASLAAALDVDATIAKPFDLDDVLAAVRMAIAKGQTLAARP